MRIPANFPSTVINNFKIFLMSLVIGETDSLFENLTCES
jgi:hypothetical protein